MNYHFRLPIGDWSGDGHEKCEYYIVSSNIPATEIIPIYNEMDKIFKVSRECKKYGSSKFSQEFIELLESKNINPTKYYEEELYVGKKDLALLIIDLIMLHDKSVKLEINNEKVPMLNNWMAMKMGTSLSLPGYGLFE